MKNITEIIPLEVQWWPVNNFKKSLKEVFISAYIVINVIKIKVKIVDKPREYILVFFI